jgi:adenosine deaminase
MISRLFRPARLVLALLVVLACARGAAAQVARDDTAATALRFEAIRTQPEALAAFLAAMPKGADLHNHAGGAVAPENFLAWALGDGACYVPVTLVLVEPCANGAVPLAGGQCSAAAGRCRKMRARSTSGISIS